MKQELPQLRENFERRLSELPEDLDIDYIKKSYEDLKIIMSIVNELQEEKKMNLEDIEEIKDCLKYEE